LGISRGNPHWNGASKFVPHPVCDGGAVTDIWCWCAAGQLVSDARLKGNAKADSVVLSRYASFDSL
jgi:hypothetical protein